MSSKQAAAVQASQSQSQTTDKVSQQHMRLWSTPLSQQDKKKTLQCAVTSPKFSQVYAYVLDLEVQN